MNILGYGNNVHHSSGRGTTRGLSTGQWEHVFTRVDDDKKKRGQKTLVKRVADPSAMTAFMDFDTAARVAGLSTRHFRRMYDGNHMTINGKFVIVRRDLEQWITDRKRLTETESSD